MAVPQTLSEALDNLYTTTWQNMKSTVVDQIFDATPFWFWMKANGALESVMGGRFLTEPLRYVKSDKVKFIGKGGTVSLSDLEFLTEATEDWKYLVDSIVRFGVDDQKNRGRNRIINLMNAKLSNSRDSLVDKIETSLTADNTANPLDFVGLQTLVADDPTAVLKVHGIPQDTNTWWRNKVKDLAGLSFAINGHAEMRTILNNTSNNLRSDMPNIIVSGQTPYEFYEDTVVEQKRIVNKKLGDAGFENIVFKGIPMIWTPSMGTRMYFLNTRFLKFKFDPSLNFDMTEWKPIPDQVNDRAAQIIIAGNLMTSRRRAQGVIFNIDTA